MATIKKTGKFGLSDISEYKEFLPSTLTHLAPERIIYYLSKIVDANLTDLTRQIVRYTTEVTEELSKTVTSPSVVRTIINELQAVSLNILDNYGRGEFIRIKMDLVFNGSAPCMRFTVYEYDNCLKLEEFRQFLDYLGNEGETIHPDVYRLMDRFVDSGTVILNMK